MSFSKPGKVHGQLPSPPPCSTRKLIQLLVALTFLLVSLVPSWPLNSFSAQQIM